MVNRVVQSPRKGQSTEPKMVEINREVKSEESSVLMKCHRLNERNKSSILFFTSEHIRVG